MKVAIDTGPLTSGDKIRGVGSYTRNLINSLQKIEKKLKKSNIKFSLETVDSDSIIKSNSKYDIVHIPYFNPYFLTVPTKLQSKLVVTIHDVIPLLYPDKYPAGIKGSTRFLRQKKAVQKIDHVITVSETSKKDIVRYLSVPQKKITPIHLAPALPNKRISNKKMQNVKKKYSLPSKFVLYVGDINYNKNIMTLINACNRAKVKLVLVGKQANEIETFENDLHYLHGPRDWIRYLFGKPHPEISHYKELIKQFKKCDYIYRLGFVPEDDLIAIYKLATVYCQPSFSEGFGLPLLEAMSCGTPAVASRTQALVEVAGDAALFVPPKNVQGFADQFSELFISKSKRGALSKKALKRAKNFSWDKTAHETLEVYRNLYKK